jgi:hypothetical protein
MSAQGIAAIAPQALALGNLAYSPTPNTTINTLALARNRTRYWGMRPN